MGLRLVSDALCRGCHAQIRWVTTEAGKAMPIDLEVTTTIEPTVVLYGDDGKRLEQLPGVERTGRVPHWATCPVREQFKRQSGKRGAPPPP
jgi:hypothetical protein